MRIPQGYEDALRIEYGNYMQFPPVEKRGLWHECEMYPDIPYKEYYKKNFNI
jgi:lipopolysaccharide cholinephosphotransferase